MRNAKSFSVRLKTGEMNIDSSDIYEVANQMIFEVNLLAGKALSLQHKLIEVMRLAPRFITDYLCLEHREKIRNQLNDSIFRNVIETPQFALPSEENIGEAHKLFSNTKRATKYTNSNYGIRVFDLSKLHRGAPRKQPSSRPGRDGSQARSRTRDASGNNREGETDIYG